MVTADISQKSVLSNSEVLSLVTVVDKNRQKTLFQNCAKFPVYILTTFENIYSRVSPFQTETTQRYTQFNTIFAEYIGTKSTD